MAYTQLNQRTITFADSPYSVVDSDQVIHVDSTGGAITINLPAILGVKTDLYVHDRTGLNAISIVANGADTINGSASILLQGADQVRYLSSIDSDMRGSV